MTDVDYGYGDAGADNNDYGYGDAAPDGTDYGYGAPDNTDYGYGAPDSTDYGYGAPDSNDYGYGDQAPATDYGYGDQSDYGYGDAPVEQPKPKKERPKRRCSVTKYSLDSTGQEATSQMDRLAQIRAGNFSNDAPPPVSSAAAGSQGEYGASIAAVAVPEPAHYVPTIQEQAKGGKLNRLRKRLSIF
jgi:hypothetical protein